VLSRKIIAPLGAGSAKDYQMRTTDAFVGFVILADL